MRHASELAEVIAQRRGPFLKQIIDDTQKTPPPPGQEPYPPEAIEQFVNGFFNVILEALEGRSQETRQFVMTTMFPAMRDSGTAADLMIGGSARVLIALAIDIVDGIKPEHRSEARGWICQVLGDYLGDMAAVWAR